MSDIRVRNATSQMVRLFIPNNSVTTGAGVTGLTNASTNLRISYMREKDSALTSYTGSNIEVQTTIGTFQQPSSSSKCRFKETPVPGMYEIQFHDDATIFGDGDTSEKVQVLVAENTTTALKIGPNIKEIQLTGDDIANIKAVVNAALEDQNLDHLVKVAKDTSWANTVTKESIIDLITSKNTSQTFDRATDALESISSLAATAGNIISIKGSTAAADVLLHDLESCLICTVDDTNFTPTSTELETADIVVPTTDQIIGRAIVFTSGNVQYQAATITGYSLESGKGHLTLSPMAVTPASGDEFVFI